MFKKLKYVVGKLIEVGRPISAFKLASQSDSNFEPKFWFDLYLDVLKTPNLEGEMFQEVEFWKKFLRYWIIFPRLAIKI